MIQKNEFLAGEGDAYHLRNRVKEASDEYIKYLKPYIKYINSNSKILEVGCGDGRNLAYLNKVTGCKVFGLEPSALAIEEGVQKYPQISFIHGTGDDLEMDDGFFDLVFFGTCLYLVDRTLLMKTISEADRVLKDKGIIGITEFDVKIPIVNEYHHKQGLKSYKMDYSQLFTVYPHYSLIERMQKTTPQNPKLFMDIKERMAVSIVYKNHEDAYINGNY